MTLNTKALCRWTACLFIVAAPWLFSGCATLAHRSSVSGQHVHTTSNCDGHGDVCPWLVGDALLLLPGVVPGVVAFAVDVGTGAWDHDAHVVTASSKTKARVVNRQERHR